MQLHPSSLFKTVHTSVGCRLPNGYSLSCLEIPYPVDFLQQSGNIFTVASEEDFDTASMLMDTIVDFVYPFDAQVNSESITINNIEELFLALISCDTVVVQNNCEGVEHHVLLFFNGLNILTINKYEYEINYPVTLIVEGNDVVINSNEEYLPAIGGSPFDMLDTELTYPIVVTQFGRDIVLNNDDDVCEFYNTLSEPCQDKPDHIQFFYNGGVGTAINCAYFINYPLDITNNGTTVEILSLDDYKAVLNSSPTAYDDIELTYPVSVTKWNNGNQISFDNGGEICDYLETCN